MHFLSTDLPEYFTPEVRSRRTFGARLRQHVLKPMAKIASYPLMGVGLTFAGLGAGLESAWVLGLLFAYPLSESVEWAATRARTYVAR
jgi:hypothetical protein